MLNPRFRETTALAILDEYVRTGSASKVCRKYGISDTTLYRWKSLYGASSKSSLSDAQTSAHVEDQLNQRASEVSSEVRRIRELLGLAV